MAKQAKKLKLTLIKSKFHRKPGHDACLTGLGLRTIHQSIVVADTPENRGMIRKVDYMLRVEEA